MPNRYTAGCRCRTCRDGWAEAARARRAAARERRLSCPTTYVVEGIKHGASGYNEHSCRCDVCVDGKYGVLGRLARSAGA